jgi:glutamate/tyrosine decarboxylase-like PLP-dependent enzyme
MERRITRNTIAMLASAPCWPFGRFDDIAGLAAVAERHGVWFHCDAAVGGYIAPFVRDLGRPIPEFDLSVPGVCSLSADLHKYGFSPKPASTILYASPEWARFQPFYFDDWAFGAFMTPSLAGSRPAGAVAAAWAVMRFLGKDGYREMAQRLMWVKDALTDGINRIRGLRAWDTDLTLLLYGAEGISIRAVAQGMKRLGYFVMGSRDADADLIHLTLDVADKLWIQTYLSDLEKVVHGVWNGDVRSGDADDARRYV